MCVDFLNSPTYLSLLSGILYNIRRNLMKHLSLIKRHVIVEYKVFCGYRCLLLTCAAFMSITTLSDAFISPCSLYRFDQFSLCGRILEKVVFRLKLSRTMFLIFGVKRFVSRNQSFILEVVYRETG